MTSGSNNEDVFEEINQTCEPGGSEWRERCVAEVQRIVANTFSRQLPAKLSTVFNAEDLAQETAFRLLRHVEEKQNFVEIRSGFVVVVARRVLIDRVRQHLAKKRLPANGFIEISPTSSTNLLNDISADVRSPSQLEMSNEFWTAATSPLDERECELVELKYNEELTYEEIGQLFGKSGQAVRSQLFRIHQKIRQDLSQCPEYESFL